MKHIWPVSLVALAPLAVSRLCGQGMRNRGGAAGTVVLWPSWWVVRLMGDTVMRVCVACGQYIMACTGAVGSVLLAYTAPSVNGSTLPHSAQVAKRARLGLC